MVTATQNMFKGSLRPRGIRSGLELVGFRKMVRPHYWDETWAALPRVCMVLSVGFRVYLIYALYCRSHMSWSAHWIQPALCESSLSSKQLEEGRLLKTLLFPFGSLNWALLCWGSPDPKPQQNNPTAVNRFLVGRKMNQERGLLEEPAFRVQSLGWGLRKNLPRPSYYH